MRVVLAIGLALATSCSSKSADRDPPPPAEAAVAIARDAATAAATPGPNCRRPVNRLIGTVGRLERAGADDDGALYDDAVDAWRTVPEACRGGEWHLYAARILRRGKGPLTLGPTRLASEADALALALDAEPHPDVLALVAFRSALGGAPPLPADACARARATTPAGAPDDTRVRYVCAHAGDDAAWATLDNLLEFPDLALRKAEALARVGSRAEARTLAEQAAALDLEAARGFGATAEEHRALLARARELLGKLR